MEMLSRRDVPVELAAMAGVDITSDMPLRDTVAYIGGIIGEIEKLTEQLGTGAEKT